MNALAEYGSGDSITIVYARKSGDEYKESTVEITLETAQGLTQRSAMKW